MTNPLNPSWEAHEERTGYLWGKFSILAFFRKRALLRENSFPKAEQRARWDQSSGVMFLSHMQPPALFCSPLKASGNLNSPNEAVEDAPSNISLMPRMFLWQFCIQSYWFVLHERLHKGPRKWMNLSKVVHTQGASIIFGCAETQRWNNDNVVLHFICWITSIPCSQMCACDSNQPNSS